MQTLLEKIQDLNELVVSGNAMEAFEKYYHENVLMQENENPPTIGKAANRDRENDFFTSIVEFREAIPLKVTVGEGITMVEWFYDYTHKEWGIKKYNQVSVQKWKDGKIIMEKFYYQS